jgi:hypothetical protein
MQSPDIGESALIDSGAVFLVIGSEMLENVMQAYGIPKIENVSPFCGPQFWSNGTPIETKFGAIIPWAVRDTKKNVVLIQPLADLIPGNHPLLIGCPTLFAMEATLSFANPVLVAEINSICCNILLLWKSNHLFMGHAPRIILASNAIIVAEQSHMNFHSLSGGTTQHFQRPDHITRKHGPAASK